MPHSPRVNGGELWVLDSGRGDLGRVDPKTGKREQVAFCPGFARGLSFWRGYALVGTSLPRDGAFKGLELEDNTKAKEGEPRCGAYYHRHPQRRYRAMDPLRGRGARIVRRGVHSRRESADVRRARQSRDAHLDHLRGRSLGLDGASRGLAAPFRERVLSMLNSRLY
jgi:hypothetical protein